MKIVAALILTTILAGCITTDIIYGNGDVVTVIDTLDRFNGELTVDFPTEIVIENGAPTVSFTTDSDMQEYFSIDTTGGNLAIHRDSKYKLVTTDQTIHVTLPFLNSVILTDASVTDTIHADSIRTITLNGNSRFTAVVNRRDLTISTNGTSVSTLSGDLKYLTVTHRSSEPLDLSNLRTLNATVENSSSSSVWLNVTAELKGTIAGSGNIELTTFTPIVDIDSVEGSGSFIYPVDSTKSL